MKPAAVISIFLVSTFVVIGGGILAFHALKTGPIGQAYVRQQFWKFKAEGDRYAAAHQYDQAIAAYDRMIAVRPLKPTGYEYRADCYYDMNRYGMVIADDNEALRLVNTPEGIEELGFGNIPRAELARDVREVKSDIYQSRGLAYIGQGKHRLAVADLTMSLRLYPTRDDAHGARAISYLALSQFDKALADARIDARQHSKEFESRLMIGKILGKMGRVREAEGADTGAIAADPRDDRGYYELIQLQDRVEDYRGALMTARMDLRGNPNSQDKWGTVGWYQYLTGNVPGAIVSDKKALSLSGNAGWIESNLGLCYAVEGDWSSASKHYRIVKSQGDAKNITASRADIAKALKRHPGSAALKQADALLRS